MGNRTFKKKIGEEYLFNSAKHVLGLIGGVDSDEIGVHFEDDEWPMMFWSTYGRVIIEALANHGPEALGRIAAASPGYHDTQDLTHWDMEQGKRMGNAHKGGSILLLLASCCVGAKIANMIRQDLIREQERKEVQQEWLLNRANQRGRPIPNALRYGG